MRTKEEHRVNEGPWVGDAHVATRIVNEVDTVVSMTVFGGADETARLTGRTPPRRQRSLRRQAFVVILPVRTVGVTGDFRTYDYVVRHDGPLSMLRRRHLRLRQRAAVTGAE